MHGKSHCTFASAVAMAKRAEREGPRAAGRVRFLSVVAMAILATASIAEAQARSRFDLPPQPLADSLRAVGSQANINVLFDPPLVADHQAPALKGEYTSSQAFTLLLVGTGIRHEFMNDHTVVLAESTATSGSAEGEGATFWGRFRVAQAEAGLPQQASERSTESPSAGVKIEEVIVTAQKREENVQDVPISISVLSGVDLDKSSAQGVGEALSRVPGLATVQFSQGGGTNITIRGVSAGSAVFNGSTPVSYYLDTVPFGFVKSAFAPDSNAYDLERVEVLRGPQGTLYGASALNGVVRILTKDADLNDFDFKMRGSVSTTEGGGDNYRGDAAINLPIIAGKLASRIVVGGAEQSGWIDRPFENRVNDANLFNLRFKVNAQPTENFSAAFSAWLARDKYGGPSISNDNEERGGTLAEPITTDYDAFGLKLGYDFGSFSVASQSGYLTYETLSRYDFKDQGLPNHVLTGDFYSTVLSQELIANSAHDGAWRWTIGGSYRRVKDRLDQEIPPDIFSIDLRDRSEAFAVFGEVTRALADHLELTAGLRYFHDDVQNDESLTPLEPAQKASFSSTTPRAVLTWKPSDDFTAYASYSEGFRSGALQNQGLAPPGFPAVRPDKLKNYEVGAKGSLWEDRVQFDAALFYIDWANVQQTLTVVSASGTVVTALVNAPSASGMGFDYGMTFRPADGLTLGVNFGWNDLEMDANVISAEAVLFSKGDRLNMSPKYVVGAFADYAFPLGAGGYEGRFALSANYASRQAWRTAAEGVTTIRPGTPMTISRASFTVAAVEHWELAFYADNLSNEDGFVFGHPAIHMNPDDWRQRIRPRTIGAQFEYRY